MAISTYLATLKWGETESAVAKVVDIKDFPDLIGDPNLLETTTLSDGAQTYIPGIKSTDMLAFTINYDKDTFAACKADENKDLFYELEFSDKTKFTWKGQHVMGVPGKGVDEVVEATLNVVPSTVITWKEATA